MCITYDSNYKGHHILTDKKKKQGCYTYILDKIQGILDLSTKKHNKVLLTRFDLRFPKGHSEDVSNKAISRFQSTFHKNLKRHGLDPSGMWCREQSREKHHHYHCFVAVDGNKIQFPHKILEQAEKNWGNTLGVDATGLVDHCTKSRKGEKQTNSYRLRRSDDDFDQVYDDCHKRLSYLAKVNTKGYAPKRAREFGCSRLKKK